MYLLAVLAASNVVAYSAPDNREALEAVQTRMIEYWLAKGKRVNPYVYHPEPEYPADVTLEQCQRRVSWKVRAVDGAESYLNGYECLLEIWPNGFPAFRANAFFYHDGDKWVYYGPLYPLSAPPRISVFDPSNDEGETILKGGAQQYDGQPNSPLYDNYDPYQSLFELDTKLDDFNY